MSTYFISGHRDATKLEFETHYVPILEELIKNRNNFFVVGDCPGVDRFSLDFLSENWFSNVTVYHIGFLPMYNRAFYTNGNFRSDIQRDFAMTLDSEFDVCWIRPGKERSGTQMNIDRRRWVNERKTKGLTYTYDERVMIESNLFLD